MANMLSSDVAYTPLGGGTATTGPMIAQEVAAPGRVRRQYKLTFPAVNLDYPAGGIPLLKGSFGCPRAIVSLKVMGRTLSAGATNPIYEWNGDPVTPKLIALVQGGAAAGAAMQESALTAITSNSQNVFVDVEGY